MVPPGAPADTDVVARIVAARRPGDRAPAGDGEYFADLPWSGCRGSVLLGAYAAVTDDPLACAPDVGPRRR